MAHTLIPREVLEAEFRRFVLEDMRDGEVWELSDDQSGTVKGKLEAILAPRFGEPGRWQMELGSGQFFQPAERLQLDEHIWSYVQAGILRLTVGKNSRRAWSGVYRTPEGRKILEGGTAIPEDVEAYLRQLKEDAPELDETAVFYVREALFAFRAKLYPSAVVMLGCAAEHLVLRMAEALLSKLAAGSQPKLKQALERGPVAAVWEAFRTRFEPHRAAIFAGEVLTSAAALDGLFLAVKNARDDGGHPQPVRTSEGAARALLQAFPEHAKAASRVLTGIVKL